MLRHDSIQGQAPTQLDYVRDVDQSPPTSFSSTDIPLAQRHLFRSLSKIRKQPKARLILRIHAKEISRYWFSILSSASLNRSDPHMKEFRHRVAARKTVKLARRRKQILSPTQSRGIRHSKLIRNRQKLNGYTNLSMRQTVGYASSPGPHQTPPLVMGNQARNSSVDIESRNSLIALPVSSQTARFGTSAEPIVELVDVPELSTRIQPSNAGGAMRRSQRHRRPVISYTEVDIDGDSDTSVKRRKTSHLSTTAISVSPSTDPLSSTTTVASCFTHASNKFKPKDLTLSMTDQQSSSTASLNTSIDPSPGLIQDSDIRSVPLNILSTRIDQPHHQSSEIEHIHTPEMTVESYFWAKISGHTLQQDPPPDQLEDYTHDDQSTSRIDRGAHVHRLRQSPISKKASDGNSPTPQWAGRYHSAASSNAGQPGSNQGSEAPSPSLKGGRSSGRGGRGGFGRGGKANRGRFGGGAPGRDRDRESPEPPPTNRTIMSQDDKNTLHHIRARQAELKKFFAVLLTQQRDALELQANRDIARLMKKSKAHTKVPEHNTVTEKLDKQEAEIRTIIDKEYEMRIKLADEDLKARELVIQNQFLNRVEQAQQEHTRGAQGDMAIFRKAHLNAADETRTDNGSDIAYNLPRFHELPEPDAQPRGYSSNHINDEKPFQAHLTSYDEQAQQEVIADDIVGPVVQSEALQNAKFREEAVKRARFKDLVAIADEELAKEEEGEELIPQPLRRRTSENPQFALSRLADCAEYISRTLPERPHVFMPGASTDMNGSHPQPLDKTSSPGRVNIEKAPTPTLRTRSSTPKSTSRRQKSISEALKRVSKDEDANSPSSSSNTSTPLPTIAPAPVRLPHGPLVSQHHPNYHHHYPHHQQHQHQRQHSHHQHLMANLQGISMSQAENSTLQPLSAQSRPPILAPLITSKLPHTSPPATPTYRQTPNSAGTYIPPSLPLQSPRQIRPPVYTQPLPPRPLIATGTPFSPQAPPLFHNPSFNMQPQPQPQPQPPTQPQPSTQSQSETQPQQPQPQPQGQGFDGRPGSASPTTSSPPPESQQGRFSLNSYGHSRPRIGGPRREPGQITFTPAQTPSSERFRAPSQPPATPPGIALYRPNSLQQLGSGSATGKLANTFVNAAPDANTRAQQAADAAKQNATRNQTQGAGPKGGRRVLLPKHY